MVARDPPRAWQHVLAILANVADLHDGDIITVRRSVVLCTWKLPQLSTPSPPPRRGKLRCSRRLLQMSYSVG